MSVVFDGSISKAGQRLTCFFVSDEYFLEQFGFFCSTFYCDPSTVALVKVSVCSKAQREIAISEERSFRRRRPKGSIANL